MSLSPSLFFTCFSCQNTKFSLKSIYTYLIVKQAHPMTKIWIRIKDRLLLPLPALSLRKKTLSLWIRLPLSKQNMLLLKLHE